MTEPPPHIFTAEEIAEANKLTGIGLLLFAALVGAFQWQHMIEREREKKDRLDSVPMGK